MDLKTAVFTFAAICGFQWKSALFPPLFTTYSHFSFHYKLFYKKLQPLIGVTCGKKLLLLIFSSYFFPIFLFFIKLFPFLREIVFFHAAPRPGQYSEDFHCQMDLFSLLFFLAAQMQKELFLLAALFVNFFVSPCINPAKGICYK